MANELRVRANNAVGTITDNPLLVGSTTFNSAGLSTFPSVSATQHAIICLDPTASAGAPEIAIITAHTAAATSATIVRGAEGSTARQHLSGTTWRHIASYYDYLQIVANAAALPSTNIYQGMLAYQQDLDKYVGRSSAGVWQDLVPMGAWTSYTPTLTQGVTLTKTVTYARYIRVGRLITVVANLLITSSGTAANSVIVGLPIAAANAAAIVGSFRYLQTGTALWSGTCFGTSTTTVELVSTNTTASLGQAPAVTAANTHTVQIAATYEAAT